MRVAIDGSNLGRHPLGVHRCVGELIRELARSEDEAEQFLFFLRPGAARRLLADRPGAQRRLVSSLVGLRALRAAWRHLVLPARLRWHRADVLHAPAYVMPLTTSLPTVLNIYDLIALKLPALCPPATVRHLGRLLKPSARKAKRIIVPTETVRQEVAGIKGVDPEKIRVVPPGVGAAFGSRAQPDDAERCERLGLARDEPYFLFVGELEPKKNLPNLIKAFFALVLEQRLDHHLVIAGRRHRQYRALQRLAAGHNIADRVHFPGRVPEADLPALYRRADVFCFPSLAEGFGLPPLEAMACGTPVVTSNIPALKETYAGASRQVDPTDLKALRLALQEAVGDQTIRRELRRQGLELAKRLNWGKSVAATREVYREAAGQAT